MFAFCVLADFAFVTETVKWSQAQTACLGLQGQFASVMDDKQAEDIADAFPLRLVCTIYL